MDTFIIKVNVYTYILPSNYLVMNGKDLSYWDYKILIWDQIIKKRLT